MINLSDALIVSDSEAVKGLVRFALGRYWGVQIREADSIEDAEAKLSERLPQIVIVDVDSAAFDGYSLVSQVRRKGVRVLAINDRFAGATSPAAVAGRQRGDRRPVPAGEVPRGDRERVGGHRLIGKSCTAAACPAHCPRL